MPIKFIKLKSADERVFRLDAKTARHSLTLNELLKSFDSDSDEEEREEEIRLHVIRGEILEMVVEWLEKHKDDPIEHCIMTDWDRDFIKRFENNNETLYELIRAANFLDIEGLVELMLGAMGDKLRGMTCGEIQNLLGFYVSR